MIRFFKALWHFIFDEPEPRCRKCKDTGIFKFTHVWEGQRIFDECWCVCETGRARERAETGGDETESGV